MKNKLHLRKDLKVLCLTSLTRFICQEGPQLHMHSLACTTFACCNCRSLWGICQSCRGTAGDSSVITQIQAHMRAGCTSAGAHHNVSVCVDRLQQAKLRMDHILLAGSTCIGKRACRKGECFALQFTRQTICSSPWDCCSRERMCLHTHTHSLSHAYTHTGTLTQELPCAQACMDCKSEGKSCIDSQERLLLHSSQKVQEWQQTCEQLKGLHESTLFNFTSWRSMRCWSMCPKNVRSGFVHCWRSTHAGLEPSSVISLTFRHGSTWKLA